MTAFMTRVSTRTHQRRHRLSWRLCGSKRPKKGTDATSVPTLPTPAYNR